MKSNFQWLCLALLFAISASAEEIRDFYSEPGLQPFMSQVTDTSVEVISPFGGLLQLQHTDLVVPGNGGLDIVFKRSYVSPQDYQPIDSAQQSVIGINWIMHFGRIVVSSTHSEKVCSQSLWSVSTMDNPSIEHQDGSREQLVLHNNSPGLITKSNWKMLCQGESILAKSPSGITYYFGEVQRFGDETSWLVSKIVDIYGNELNFSYDTGSNTLGFDLDTRKYLTNVSASDGRQVEITYEVEVSGNGYFTYIESNNKVWTYYSEKVNPENTYLYYLKEVTRPDGLSWQYIYNPPYGEESPESGSGAVNQIVYPHGATTSFLYDRVYFDGNPESLFSTVLASKTTDGPNIVGGTWTYTYSPNSIATIDPNSFLDETVIIGPDRIEKFHHYGFSYAKNRIDALWLVGLLYKHQIFDRQSIKLEESINGWGYRIISDENFYQGRGLVDEEVRVAQLENQYIWRDGAGYNTYFSNYDAYGNVGTVVRDSPITGISDHVTKNTYLNDEDLWKIGLILTTSIEEVGVIENTYDNSTRDLIFKTTFGVGEEYSYYTDGSLASVTNANDQVVIYQDYYRGIARREIHPEGVVINKQVNPTGTIKSYTDGEGKTKNFQYDSLNRIEFISYPLNSPVSFSYGLRSKSLSRGNLTVSHELDGYGREIKETKTDTSTGQSIVTNYSYDVTGNRTFVSYPNSTLGTTLEYDPLRRNVKTIYADGAFTETVFDSPIKTRSIDEEGNVTSYLYNFYGSPDNQKELLEIETQEGQITSLERNKLGQITKISQGKDQGDGTFTAQKRLYSYDERMFLVEESHPEIGSIVYVKDDMDNILTKSYGPNIHSTYTYDNLNRLISIDFADAESFDISQSYDRRNLLISAENDNGSRGYVYDDNGNLTTENITILGLSYTIGYQYDQHDYLDTLTYPSLTSVAYTPDAFGRPTVVGDFATALEYFASGQIKKITYGNGVIDNYTQNNRLLIDKVVSSNSAVDLSYTYNPTLTTASIINNLDHTFDVSVTYDGDLRLASVSGKWGTDEYEYDGQSNVKLKSIDGYDSEYRYSNGLVLDIDNTHSGEYITYTYDPYGNVKYQTAIPRSLKGAFPPPQPVWSKQFTFNANNQLLVANEVKNNGGTTSNYAAIYQYGPLGNLIYRQGETEFNTRIVYSASGTHIGEYIGNDASAGKENIYLGSKLVATSKYNHSPIIELTDNMTVIEGQNVVVTAIVKDYDSELQSLEWTQISGELIDYASNDESLEFTVPVNSEGATYIFEIKAVDSHNAESISQIVIRVAPNTPPVADAGPDQSVLAGSKIYLDGTASHDLEGLSGYQWSQISGLQHSIFNASTASPYLITNTGLADDESLLIELKVTDTKGLQSTDTVTINVTSITKDVDIDGLPDYWEQQYFSGLSAEPLDDVDGDGLTNLVEMTSKTHPLEATLPKPIQSIRANKARKEGLHNLWWNAEPTANQYKVYWSNSSDITIENANVITTSNNFLTLHEPLNNSTVYFMVQGVNGAGLGPLSGILYSTEGASYQSGSWISKLYEPRDPSSSTFASNNGGVSIWTSISGPLLQIYSESYNGANIPSPLADVSGLSVRRVAIDLHRNISILLEDSAGNYSTIFYNHRGDQWTDLLPISTSGSKEVHLVTFTDNNYQAVTGIFWIDEESSELLYQTYCLSCVPATGLTSPTAIYSSASLQMANSFKFETNDDGQGILTWAANVGGNSTATLEGIYLSVGSGGNLNFSPVHTVASHSVKGKNGAQLSVIGTSFQPDRLVLIGSYESPSNPSSSVCFESTYNLDNDSWSSPLDVATCQLDGVRVYKGNDQGDSILIYTKAGTTDVIAKIRNASGAWLDEFQLITKYSNEVVTSADAVVLEAYGTIKLSWISAQEGVGRFSLHRQDYFGSTNSWANYKDADILYVDDQVTPKVFSVKDRVFGARLGAYYKPSNQHSAQYRFSYYYPAELSSLAPNSAPIIGVVTSSIIAIADQVIPLEVSIAGDQDGSITGYLWEQTAGDEVIITNSTSTSATFTAPSARLDQTLKFTVTATDNNGNVAVEHVDVFVQGTGIAGDTEPPVTQISSSRTTSKGIAYFDISLVSSEPGETYFRFVGQGTITAGGSSTEEWQQYTAQVTVKMDKGGTGNFEFYSTDEAANQEDVKTEVLQ